MGKGRLEAFSDDVITAMVLELKVPQGESMHALEARDLRNDPGSVAYLHSVINGCAPLQFAREAAGARTEGRGVIRKAVACVARVVGGAAGAAGRAVQQRFHLAGAPGRGAQRSRARCGGGAPFANEEELLWTKTQAGLEDVFIHLMENVSDNFQ